MHRLTKPQRAALKNLYDRLAQDTQEINADILQHPGRPLKYLPTYRQFRKTVRHPIAMDCVMIPYNGMWLGIEPDGYAHT